MDIKCVGDNNSSSLYHEAPYTYMDYIESQNEKEIMCLVRLGMKYQIRTETLTNTPLKFKAT